MMNIVNRKSWIAGAVLATASLAALFAFADDGELTTATLVTESGRHEIKVELADTPEARMTGLMNRASMPENQGMLFDFGATRPVTMWMKDTLIPLDMLFLDEGGVVSRIATNTQPLSLDMIPSGEPVRYVLELNGGAAARFGVETGDRLEHPVIGGN